MAQRCDAWTELPALAALAIMLALAPASLRAQAPLAELPINAFAGASNLPIWVAQREGLFARRGIAVTLSSPAGSLDQFRGLIDGRYPIIVTAFDNVVAYRSGQGPAEVGAIGDLVAVVGIDSGLLTLVAAQGIDSIADLKGRTLAVDAPSTGFSFALREILQKSGLDASALTYIAAGNSDGRWKAIQEGRASAALLALPADFSALRQGGKALTTVATSLGNYLGNVVAVRQGWSASHRRELRAFLQAMRDAMAWLSAPAHKARAIDILHEQMPSLDAAGLERVYGTLLDPRQGLIRSLRLDPRAAQTVLSLRAKYSSSSQSLQAPGAYFEAR